MKNKWHRAISFTDAMPTWNSWALRLQNSGYQCLTVHTACWYIMCFSNAHRRRLKWRTYEVKLRSENYDSLQQFVLQINSVSSVSRCDTSFFWCSLIFHFHLHVTVIWMCHSNKTNAPSTLVSTVCDL